MAGRSKSSAIEVRNGSANRGAVFFSFTTSVVNPGQEKIIPA